MHLSESPPLRDRLSPRDWLWSNPALDREWLLRRRPERPGTGRREWVRESMRWIGLLLLIALYAGVAHWLSADGRSPWEARAFLLVVLLGYLLAVTALLPGPAAAAIAGERERQAWADLLLTSLTPGQLVAAKYVAVLWPAVRLLGLTLPVLVPALHAARLPVEKGPLLLLVLLAANGTVAAGCLWCSVRFRRTLAAVTAAYLATGSVFWLALVSLPQFFVRGENLWWYGSPVWQVTQLVLFEPVGSPLVLPLVPEWLWFLLGCVLVSVAGLRAVVRWTRSLTTD